MKTTNPWIENIGDGICPLKDHEVKSYEIRWNGIFPDDFIEDEPPSSLLWDFSGAEGGDITHYRVIEWNPGYGPTAWKSQKLFIKLNLQKIIGKSLEGQMILCQFAANQSQN